MSSAPQTKPKITCHVLDTTIGRPGASIPATLTCLSAYAVSTSSSQGSKKDIPSLKGTSYKGLTNSDGRIVSWENATFGPSLNDLFAAAVKEHEKKPSGEQQQEGEEVVTSWEIRFEMREYWEGRGVQSFFEDVVVRFLVRKAGPEEHYHVPVLVGPFSYTTYRGS